MQSNDSEDDAGSWENNGGKDQADGRNVTPRRTKEKTNRDEQYARRHQEQNN